MASPQDICERCGVGYRSEYIATSARMAEQDFSLAQLLEKLPYSVRRSSRRGCSE